MASSLAAIGRLDGLDDFLVRERGRRWSWSHTNCALWVADWIRDVSGIDPAAGMRGRADSPESWKALLAAEGGFVPIIGHAMDCCGFERTQSPDRGDVAIVSVPIAMCDRMPVVGTVAAICAAHGFRSAWPLFVTRSINGLHYERFAMVTAWRMVYRAEMTLH